MAELKPAYLIHGDDHGAVAERRAGLRALAEAPGSEAAVELLEGESASPGGVAAALSAMTLAVGRRVIVVEGVERWRQADVEKELAQLMAEMPPETTLALFAREASIEIAFILIGLFSVGVEVIKFFRQVVLHSSLLNLLPYSL